MRICNSAIVALLIIGAVIGTGGGGGKKETIKQDITITDSLLLSTLNGYLKELAMQDDIAARVVQKISDSYTGGAQKFDIFKRNGSVKLLVQRNAELTDYLAHCLDKDDLMAAKLAGKDMVKLVHQRISNTGQFNNHILMTPEYYFAVEEVAKALDLVESEQNDFFKEDEGSKSLNSASQSTLHSDAWEWIHWNVFLEKTVFLPLNHSITSVIDGAVAMIGDHPSEYDLHVALNKNIDILLIDRQHFIKEGGFQTTLTELWQYFHSTYCVICKSSPHSQLLLMDAPQKTFAICRIANSEDQDVHNAEVGDSSANMKRVYLHMLPIPKSSSDNAGSFGHFFAYIIKSGASQQDNRLYHAHSKYSWLIAEARSPTNIQQYAEYLKQQKRELVEVSIRVPQFIELLAIHLGCLAVHLPNEIQFEPKDLTHLRASSVVFRLPNGQVKFLNIPILYPHYNAEQGLAHYLRFVLQHTIYGLAPDAVVKQDLPSAFFKNLGRQAILDEYECVVASGYENFGTDTCKPIPAYVWIITAVVTGLVLMITVFLVYLFKSKKNRLIAESEVVLKDAIKSA